MPRPLAIVLAAMGAVLLVIGGAAAALLVTGTDSGSGGQATGRGYLGLAVTLAAPAGGLRVASVEPGGPAARAGVQVGDILRAVDGTVVRTPEQLRSAVEALPPERQVALTLERGDRELRLTVRLGEAPAGAAIEPTPATRPFAPAPGGPGQGAPGLGRLSPELQELLRHALEQGSLSREQLDEILRRIVPAQAGGVRFGTVQSISETTLVIRPLESATDLRFSLTARTEFRRGAEVVRPAAIRAGDSVIVLTFDGTSAFAVISLGTLRLPP